MRRKLFSLLKFHLGPDPDPSEAENRFSEGEFDLNQLDSICSSGILQNVYVHFFFTVLQKAIIISSILLIFIISLVVLCILQRAENKGGVFCWKIILAMWNNHLIRIVLQINIQEKREYNDINTKKPEICEIIRSWTCSHSINRCDCLEEFYHKLLSEETLVILIFYSESCSA